MYFIEQSGVSLKKNIYFFFIFNYSFFTPPSNPSRSRPCYKKKITRKKNK